MTNAQSLYGLATDLLASAVAVLAGTPGGAPSTQYVSHGPPPFDCCDTVTVHVGTLTYAPGISRTAPQGGAQADPKMPIVLVVPLTITALRCQNAQPAGGLQITLPAASAMQADAQAVYADGWSLMCGIRKRILDNTLFPGHPCRIWDFDNVLPVSPEGGCLGWTMSLYVALDAFDPPGA